MVEKCRCTLTLASLRRDYENIEVDVCQDIKSWTIVVERCFCAIIWLL